MLKLVNIVKDYPMKDQEPVHALKGLTINFRRNEFVSILGPSGCGKTTLLNIIGGLDRYTSGDLIIEGKSTKDYKDGDWDTYRNHSIGFVFQTYNLIPHQSIIKNVELALTIGGVSKEERKQRALRALEKVGLKGLEKKKPNQLSGGQMQRVAIARALINEPEILLADEPTGALDSETSIQIMDLLKEVAKDCLVIMVTHNPDLAEAYSSRIVKMKDGLLLSDSLPFSDEEEKKELEKSTKEKVEVVNKGTKKRSSMSFFTATGLSLSNLISKLKRTILIAIAGSIGIIGVSAVLAVSNGVHNYIDNMQNDMISQYPISIAETSVDYTSLLTGLSNDEKREIVEFSKEDSVGLDSLISYLMDKYKDFTSVKTNDINFDLLEYVDTMPENYVSSINKNYGLDMTNNVFTEWNRDKNTDKTFISLNGLTQMYISELQTVDGFSEYALFVDLFTDFMKEIPAEKDYILEQYDIIKGEYPTSANDIVLVVDENQTLTDLIYAQMGFFTEDEFINIARKCIMEHDESISPEEIAKYEYPTSYTFDEILGKKLKYYPHDSIWHYETLSFDVISFETTLPIRGQNFDVTFSFQYDDVMDSLKADISTSGYNLSSNFYRSNGAVDASNPFKGNWSGKVLGTDLNLVIDDTNVALVFDSPSTYQTSDNITLNFTLTYTGMSIPFTVVYDSTSDTFNGTGAGQNFVVTRIGTPGSDIFGDWITYLDVGGTLTPLSFSIHQNNEIIFHSGSYNAYNNGTKEVKGYMYDANVQPSWTDGSELRISAILKKKPGVNFGCLSRGVYYTRALTKKMMNDARYSDIVSGENSIQQYIGSSFEEDKAYEAYVKYTYTSYAKGDGDLSVKDVFGYANALNTDLSSSLSSLISIRGTSNTTYDKAYLRSLSGLAVKEKLVDSSSGLVTRTFEELPESISIYPKDFKMKKKVVEYLKEWNEDKDITLKNSGKVIAREDRQELAYTDTVELIVNVINTMINIITVSLIAFTSLALVVSCFMIAVITYISTMERVKEIGVIRSLGGRKKDVSRLFVAETLIIGLASGVIGIGVTYLLSLILNLIVGAFVVGISAIADLPFTYALIMIGLSIALNVISGLIPSMKASNQDPVAALRSE